MDAALPPKPQPEPTPESLPYWEGLRRRRLMLQRCAGCGRVRHYPRPMCDGCRSFAAEWIEASGDASAHSWTVAHHAFHLAFRPELPYVLVTADLPEGARLLAQLRGAGAESRRPGLPLRVDFEEGGDGLTLLRAPDLVRFLGRLIRDAGRKVFLILDQLKVHRARLTRDWLAEHRAEIEVHHLPPAYSPDLNPDEGVNVDLKQAVPREAPARSKQQLMRAVISHMHSLSRQPRRIRSIFRHQQFRYAA